MAVPVVVLGAVLLAATAHAEVSVVWGEGTRARLPCSVEGAPVPRRPPPPLEAPAPADAPEHTRLPYIWRHHGKEVPSKKVSWDGSLEVVRRPGAEGEYQCEMLTLPGRLLSYPMHLRFPSMEEDFEVQPSNSTAPPGQPLALPCRVRSAPPAAISWLKDGQALPHDSRYRFLDNDLLIINIKNEDAGLYRCQAMNERMDRTQVSDPATVVVSSAAESPPALVALATEPNVTVEVGGPATLACPVRGWPKPKVYWELNQPSGQTRRLDSVGEVLTISRTTADDNGVYTCRIEGHPDLYKNFTLNVWERVRVVHPPASRRVQRAGTVRMDCTAEGTPQPTIRWYKDGRPISITGPIKLMRSSKTQLIELVISGATSKDAGTYQCFADNGYSVASAWAQLNVTGGGTAEPEGVGCAPVDVRTIQVRWRHKDPANIVAYTVHYSPKGGGTEMTGVPEKATAQNISIQPLSAFSFKVRAYTTASASDYSDNVVCQGQGVPVDVWRTKGRVTVSWAQFAKQTAAVQWLLQVRKPTDDIVNVTLPGNTTKYELDMPAGEKWFVRLLGSKDLQWLDQDLKMVQWTSTPDADRDNNRERNALPTIQEPVRVWPRGALITWHHGDEGTPSRHIYVVCVKIRDRLNETCQQNLNRSAKIEDLQPNTQYEVRIQALTGGSSGFSQPLHFVTPPEESQRFSDVHYTPVNSSSVRVWWRAAEAALGPQLYTVRYSPHLLLPIDKWNALNVTTNDALVPLGGNQRMFVIVTAYAPIEYSLVLNITPPHIDTNSLKNIKYEHTDDGLSIVWSESEGGSATEMYSVRYSHNLTMPIEKWTEKNLTRTQLYNYHVAGVPDGAWTYVVVSPLSDARASHVMLNIPPSPARTHRAMLLGVSMGALVCAVCAIAGVAVCLWRRRKRYRIARRRATSNNDGVEDGSEMKSIGRGAGSAANGGARGAGEPLLNGHVRITENPAVRRSASLPIQGEAITVLSMIMLFMIIGKQRM